MSRVHGLWIWCWPVAVLILILGVWSARVTVREGSTSQPLSSDKASQSSFGTKRWVASKCRTRPLSIDPVDDFKGFICEEDLRRILTKVIPRWPTFKLAPAIHALRLWGTDGVFPESDYPSPYHLSHTFSGKELIGLFLDDHEYHRFVPDGESLLFDTRFGIAVRTHYISGHFEGPLGHVDHLLRTCGEIGLPSTIAVRTPRHVGTVAELIAEAQARFDPEQELEWTAEALALYLPPERTWTNRFGDTFSFDDVARRLLDEPRGHGACFGTHVPHALIVLWRIDEQCSILHSSTRIDISVYFGKASDALIRVQKPTGYWPTPWIEGGAAAPAKFAADDRSALAEKVRFLVSTSHHLEWIALAPPEFRPPTDTVERATAFLVRYLCQASVQRLSHNYLPVSHAVCALCLMKNKSSMQILCAPPHASTRTADSSTLSTVTGSSCMGLCAVAHIGVPP